MKSAIAALTVAFGAASALAGSVTPITIKGNGRLGPDIHNKRQTARLTQLTAFFKGNERFYIRGV